MTPTNDAPVTVEQCDREAAADWIGGDEGRWLRGDDPDWVSGSPDNTPLVQAFARHRLAALASAPDGDEVEGLFEALHALERIRDLTPAKANADTAQDMHGAVSAIAGAAIDRLSPALARPRAAVGEQSRSRRLTEEEARELVGFEPETILTCLREWGYVEPAKVEG